MAHRSSSSLSIRWNAKIVLGGPAHLEHVARMRLKHILLDGYADGYPGEESFDGLVSSCYYLAYSGRAAVYAEIIANSVVYIPRGRKIVVGIKELDLLYRNGGEWKWWARLRSGKGTRDTGEVA